METQQATHTTLPAYRYGLKGAIHAGGYRTVREFSEAVRIDEALISRIVNGWLYPPPKMQVCMARALGLSLKELAELL